MLEKDPWSYTPDHDAFATSYDGQTGKHVSRLAFNDTRISNYRFKSSNITSNSEVCNNDLNFFNSCCEDKESSDVLYNDNWPDMGNFEDVDKMLLSSCNSSFGVLDVTGNDNEMDWFTQECEEVASTDFKFPCCEPSDLINTSRDHLIPDSDDKKAYMYAKELNDQSDLDRASAEIGLLNVPESSSICSGSDDISLEASILLQLQQVLEHLDLRTKLCIKDSLYRLATSAEQRHNHAGLISSRRSTADYADIGRPPLVTAATNKCTGFLGIETDTNPIDRLIAHLLFHTPSDSSTLPASSFLKPTAKIHGFITNLPTVDIKLDCHEKAANRSAAMIAND